MKVMRDLTAKGSLRAGDINSVQSVELADPLTVTLVLKQPERRAAGEGAPMLPAS